MCREKFLSFQTSQEQGMPLPSIHSGCRDTGRRKEKSEKQTYSIATAASPTHTFSKDGSNASSPISAFQSSSMTLSPARPVCRRQNTSAPASRQASERTAKEQKMATRTEAHRRLRAGVSEAGQGAALVGMEEVRVRPRKSTPLPSGQLLSYLRPTATSTARRQKMAATADSPQCGLMCCCRHVTCRARRPMGARRGRAPPRPLTCGRCGGNGAAADGAAAISLSAPFPSARVVPDICFCWNIKKFLKKKEKRVV